MTKIVNLDELSAPSRTLTYKGVDHEVLDLDVESFIAFQRELTELIKSQEENDTRSTVDTAKQILARCVPSLTNVGDLNMRQLMAAVTLVADFYPTAEGESDPGNG